MADGTYTKRQPMTDLVIGPPDTLTVYYGSGHPIEDIHDLKETADA